MIINLFENITDKSECHYIGHVFFQLKSLHSEKVSISSFAKVSLILRRGRSFGSLSNNVIYQNLLSDEVGKCSPEI